jgi:hypothetical protein
MMRTALAIMVLLLSAGCMNMAASLQPEDAAVPATREASDCVPIIFGFAYGTATLDEALAEAVLATSEKWTGQQNKNLKSAVRPTPQKITKIRRVLLHDYSIFMFGARCVEVVGE